MIDFSLVMPVQNQAEIISKVVKSIVKVLKENKIKYQLVMVENGSSDKTLVILKHLAKKNNKIKVTVSDAGYGRAVIHGLNLADGKYVCYMPSDGQCDEKVLPQVFIGAKKTDLAKVFRTTRESILRTSVSLGFNFLANLLFNLKVKDINASPTCFLKSKLKILKLKSPDSFLDTELLIKAKYFKWQIVRIPMRNFKREGGKSTVKPPIVLEFLKNMLEWKFIKFKQWKNEIKKL